MLSLAHECVTAFWQTSYKIKVQEENLSLFLPYTWDSTGILWSVSKENVSFELGTTIIYITLIKGMFTSKSPKYLSLPSFKNVISVRRKTSSMKRVGITKEHHFRVGIEHTSQCYRNHMKRSKYRLPQGGQENVRFWLPRMT